MKVTITIEGEGLGTVVTLWHSQTVELSTEKTNQLVKDVQGRFNKAQAVKDAGDEEQKTL